MSQKTGERLIIGLVIAVVIYLYSTGGGAGGGRTVDYEEGAGYEDQIEVDLYNN